MLTSGLCSVAVAERRKESCARWHCPVTAAGPGGGGSLSSPHQALQLEPPSMR